MKLYVFNYHRLTAYLLMLLSVIAVTALLSVPKSGIRGVFAVQRQVPVYSVDTEEKVAAVEANLEMIKTETLSLEASVSAGSELDVHVEKLS